jgi:hypothetical protein
MATLTAKLTLTSTDWHSDSLSISPSQSITISGDEQSVGRFTTSTTATKLPVGSFDSTNKKVWVYMKNMSTTSAEHIRIYEDNGAAVSHKFANLGAGEWAFFPYADNDLIWVDTASGTPVLEYGIFEV